MNEKTMLETLARKSWKKLEEANRDYGYFSPEAKKIRDEWATLDKAFRLVYNERIDYYNIKA